MYVVLTTVSFHLLVALTRVTYTLRSFFSPITYIHIRMQLRPKSELDLPHEHRYRFIGSFTALRSGSTNSTSSMVPPTLTQSRARKRSAIMSFRGTSAFEYLSPAETKREEEAIRKARRASTIWLHKDDLSWYVLCSFTHIDHITQTLNSQNTGTSTQHPSMWEERNHLNLDPQRFVHGCSLVRT